MPGVWTRVGFAWFVCMILYDAIGSYQEGWGSPVQGTEDPSAPGPLLAQALGDAPCMPVYNPNDAAHDALCHLVCDMGQLLGGMGLACARDGEPWCPWASLGPGTG